MADVVTFAIGLAGLLIGGHFVVGGASVVGARFGLTPTVIGLTIVAAGTSAPELAVVFQAIAADDTELAVGSIIGSNIANVLLVLGFAAAYGKIRVTSRVVRVDVPIMIGASVALLVMSLDGKVSRGDGVLLLAALVTFIAWTLRASSSDARAGENAGRQAESTSDRPTSRTLVKALVGFVLGAALLAVAAGFVVSGAEGIATSLGVPELIIGLTIVALGTSAPEIVTSVIAVLRGDRELAVGNAIGSNIFNILLVLGVTGMLSPAGISLSDDAVALDLPIMVAAAVACLPIIFWDNTLDRWEGFVFLAYYGAYLVFLVLDATGHRAADPFAFVMLSFVAPLTVITAGVVIFRTRAAAT